MLPRLSGPKHFPFSLKTFFSHDNDYFCCSRGVLLSLEYLFLGTVMHYLLYPHWLLALFYLISINRTYETKEQQMAYRTCPKSRSTDYDLREVHRPPPIVKAKQSHPALTLPISFQFLAQSSVVILGGDDSVPPRVVKDCCSLIIFFSSIFLLGQLSTHIPSNAAQLLFLIRTSLLKRL